jgi:hypothetical protein
MKSNAVSAVFRGDSSVGDFAEPSLVSCSSAELRLPRFSLKKRPMMTCGGGGKSISLVSAVNSAFFSGLFADVTQDQALSSFPSNPSPPLKKQRLTNSKSMTRCGKSFKSLIYPDELLASPSAAVDFFQVEESFSSTDSLYYQLSCVSDSSSDGFCATRAANLVFPDLPSTVSAYSTTGKTLTRKISDLQTFDSEIFHNDKNNSSYYGWFVEMDDQPDRSSFEPMRAKPTTKLAFLADKNDNTTHHQLDPEVEWAKAADTVDDVLGDLF